MKKKTTIKPIPAPRITPLLAQKLDEARNENPALIYAIRDGRVVINWPETLEKLQSIKDNIRTKFGVAASGREAYFDAMKQAARAAGQWPTCSCGSLCRAIPRKRDSSGSLYGPPKDEILGNHGLGFYNRIQQGDLTAAKEHMEKIEARATTLLRRLGKKKRTYQPA